MTVPRRAVLGAIAVAPVAVLPAAAAAAAECTPARKPPRAAKKRRGAKGLVPDVEVAVVGAGVFGAWTAWHLARGGHSVRLFDAYGAGHARSSSGGESRVIRMSYGADTLYSAMAQESLPFWQALSDSASVPIFHRTGVLWFGPADDAYLAQSRGWLAANRVPHTHGDAASLQNQYRQIQFFQGEAGFVETGAGALIAGRGVQETVADSGVAVERMVMPAPLQRKNDALYHLPDGGTAGALVYACGPWLPELFPQLLAGRIRATRQEVFHFGAPQGDMRFTPPQLPVWLDHNGGAPVYGIPDLEGQGFKIAFDTHGPEVDPDSEDRRVTAEGVARARVYLAQRFPSLAKSPLIMSRVCQYENSSNGDFLIDRLPGHDRVWLVGGGSGHGFKHGPAVGKRVAQHLFDPMFAVEPRFSLATKGTEAARTVF